MNLYKLSLLSLIAVFSFSCSNDETGGGPIDPNDPSVIIWSGAEISFTKLENADPTLEENQDRLTDKVWLTRGNDGGQIYNALTETSANKDSSPAGTKWALGRTSDLENLTFKNFRAAVGDPKSIVGKDLVLHLTEENIFLNIRFTEWSQNKLGGFAYVRASE